MATASETATMTATTTTIKTKATAAAAWRQRGGEDGGSFAILISAFVTPGGTIYGEPGGGVEFARER